MTLALRAVGLLAAAALAGPGTALAAALPAGVHLNPGSPASQEYAVPFGVARSTGQPGPPTGGELFGAGITAPAARRRGAAGGAITRAHRAIVHRSRLFSAQWTAESLGRGGGPGALWMVAAAAAVLALGWLGGASVIRLHRRTRPGTG